jgi:hypothetical protein
MKAAQDSQNLVFENVWEKDMSAMGPQVLEIWKKYGGPTGPSAVERLKQIVFVVKNSGGDVVGISTAFMTYIQQLRNHLFACRLIILPDYRVPGLTSKLLVLTRDYLESIHGLEKVNPAIGLITLVENQRMKEKRNEAIWPASGMVYIGNSKQGNHIRVYYFRGAHILP